MRQPIPFGKYLLLDRISVGGMAEVFRAKSYGVEGFEKVIAIKRILPSMGEDRDFIKMFIDEAKIAGQLSHANVCQIFELGRHDGAHFIAMEYIWGKDLLQIQNRYKKLGQIMPIDMACFVVSKVCEGLDYAHRKKDAMGRPLQIVHRDCSPQNVLVSYEGEVKIIDFGIAKAASRSSRTMAGVLKGKFGYMSPEQVRGLPLDRRSDLFALGTILYESLTGERLFLGESDFSTLEKVRNVDIQPPTALNRNIPAEVEAIVMRALTRDPDDRYQWCSEMRADLQQYLMSRPEVFTAKSLSVWLREAFAGEVEHERRSMEQYKNLGRDGLIAGRPQAMARLDVVQHLGAPGPVEGDPTTLGGPSFEDMMADQGLVPRASSGQARSELGEEVPTELFGEIGRPPTEDDQPTHDHLRPVVGPPPAAPPLAGGAPSVVVDVGPANMQWGGSAAQQAQEAARLARAAAEAPTISPAAGLSLPDLSALAGLPGPAISFTPPGVGAASAFPASVAFTPPGPSSFTPPGMAGAYVPGSSFTPPGMPSSDQIFGTTSNVTPLPPPASDLSRLRASRRRRSSVFKDVAIGIAIAGVVLGLFAAGKYLFFGSKPGARTAEAAGLGTIAVVPTSDAVADVYIDGEKVGVVKRGAEPLTLEKRPVGTYTIKLMQDGQSRCEKSVEVKAGEPSIVSCPWVERSTNSGVLVLEGLTADHRVTLDDEPVAAAQAGALELVAGREHVVRVEKAGALVKELRPEVIAGQELRRVVGEPVVAAATPGAAIAAAPAADAAKAGAGEGAATERKAEERKDERKAEERKDERKPDERKPDERKPDDKKPDDKKPVDRKPDDKKPDDKKPDPGADPRKPDGAAPIEDVGYLIANTTPWARVLIDGKDTGRNTPIAKRSAIKLKPGKHVITFVVGTQKFKHPIVVTAGETVKLIEDLPVKE